MSHNQSETDFFDKEFTKQEAIPEVGIQQAMKVLRSGRLHRYNTVRGEPSETDLLEKEFANFIGSKYCLACASCGSALYLSLISAGVRPGEKVLTNAYSLAPVPGAIVNASAEPILVEINENYTIDFKDLEQKARKSGAKFLLLSHMRGHMADMDLISEICQSFGLYLIEDCAHTMGAMWNNHPSGSFGKIGCYSTQTYKHINSGEGGLITTDEDEVIAKATLYSGSYMLYERHISRPQTEVFNKYRETIPNFSLRMDNLRAAILRPQLKDLRQRCERWNRSYRVLEEMLSPIENIHIPVRPTKEQYVGSSFQFNIEGATRDQIKRFLVECSRRGVEIKWFGLDEPQGYTSNFEHWQFVNNIPELPRTRKVLDGMCDFRIPLTFSLDDCQIIAKIIKQVACRILD